MQRSSKARQDCQYCLMARGKQRILLKWGWVVVVKTGDGVLSRRTGQLQKESVKIESVFGANGGNTENIDMFVVSS